MEEENMKYFSNMFFTALVVLSFGFAKDFDQNLELLKNLNFFTTFDLPILVGLSRKSFVKKKYGIKNSLNGTLELNKIALKNGADIIRVHDVKEHLKLIK